MPVAPSRMNCISLVENSRTAPVGRPSARVLYFRSWFMDWK